MTGNTTKLKVEVDFDAQGAIKGVRQMGSEFDKTGQSGDQAVRKVDAALGGLDAESKGAAKSAKQLGTELDAAGKEGDRAIRKADDSVGDLNTEEKGAGKSAKQLGNALDKAGDEGGKSIRKAGTTVGELNDSLGVGTKLVVGLGAAFGAMQIKELAIDVATVGAAFKQDIATVGGVARATTSELAAMEAQARAMGESTEWTASQAAGGLQFLSMAGLDAGKSVAALPAALDLATAGNIDLARAADISTNAMSAMRLPVEALTRINDTFIRTITTSNTNMEMLAESFKYAAPVAAGYGMEIETLNALIGLLGNQGIQGSMAGTQLAAAFSDAHKVFDLYHVSTKRADGSTKDLVDAIKLLQQRGTSAGEIMEMFGERSGRAMLALQGVGGKALDEYIAKINDAEGATSELARRMRDTTDKDFAAMKSALESLSLDIFDEFETSARQSIQAMTKAIRDNKDEIVDFLRAVGHEADLSARALKPLGVALIDLTGISAKLMESTPGGATAIGYGIVGRVLFGSWGPAKVLASLEVLSKSMEDINSMDSSIGKFSDKYDYGKLRLPSFNQLGRDLEELDAVMAKFGEVFTGRRDWNTGEMIKGQEDLAQATIDAQIEAALAARLARETEAKAREAAAQKEQAFMRQQAAQALELARADKVALDGRLKEYQKFYGELEKLISQQAALEAQHIRELNDLYRQKIQLQQSTADLVRGLQESQMSPEDKYTSQQTALQDNFARAMELSGQEQVKALESYQREVASFAQTWSEGIGTVSSTEIVDQAIIDIQRAGEEQQRALDELAEAKQAQIEIDKIWGAELAASADQANERIDALSGVIAELDQQIQAMDKEIAIEGKDLVSGTVAAIKQALDELHDKTVTLNVNTVRRDVYVGSDGSVSANKGDFDLPDFDLPDFGTPWLDSYAKGTDYVPKTGPYLLHEGEGVIPAAENRARQASGGGLTITGGVQIVLPAGAIYAAKTDEDWRRITRDYIAPELLALGGRYARAS